MATSHSTLHEITTDLVLDFISSQDRKGPRASRIGKFLPLILSFGAHRLIANASPDEAGTKPLRDEGSAAEPTTITGDSLHKRVLPMQTSAPQTHSRAPEGSGSQGSRGARQGRSSTGWQPVGRNVATSSSLSFKRLNKKHHDIS